MHKWFGLFALFLIQCSSKEETPCTYKSTPKTTLMESEVPQLMGLSFDQQKLIHLMWVPEEQCACYLSKNGGVKSYKINDPRFTNTPGTFPHLPTPSSNGLREWQDSQWDAGGNLLGLTAFDVRIWSDTIAYTRIYVRNDGPMWSLWHEYAHFLIGQMRSASPELSVPHVKQENVIKLRNAAVALEETREDASTAWEKYFYLDIQYMRKTFGDEILIEALLLDYFHQAGALLNIAPEESLNAKALIDNFYTQFLYYKAVTTARLQLLRSTSSENFAEQMDAHLQQIEEFHTQLKNVYVQVGLPIPF